MIHVVDDCSDVSAASHEGRLDVVVVKCVLGYHRPVSSVRKVLAQVAEFARQFVHDLLEDHRVDILT